VWKLINTSKRLIPDLNRLATNSLGPTTIIRQKPILLLGVERERERERERVERRVTYSSIVMRASYYHII
jgi:hypothetical protein